MLVAIAVGVVVGCICGSFAISVMLAPTMVNTALAPSPTTTLTVTRVIFPTITLAPPASRTATPIAPQPTTPAPPINRTPTRTPISIVQHLLLGRPVALNVDHPWPSTVYLYGTTRLGDLDVHHGEEFENPVGTPIYAVADGTIVVAGQDNVPMCGDEGNKVCGRDLAPDSGGYYGKVIVLQLAQTYNGQKVFALYGHLSKMGVTKGDVVKRGDPIGEIGASGIALGPHVHFEVRLGVNDYAHTRNPILWMTPMPGRGALVGRIVDYRGNLVRGAIITITPASGEGTRFTTESYSRDKYPAVNSDDEIGENFALSELVPGDYIVRVQGQPFSARVTIEEGKLVFVDIGLPQPPTITPTSTP